MQGGSKNCREFPLVEKRGQRENKSLDGEEESTPPCTDLSTYELGVEGKWGEIPIYLHFIFTLHLH